MKEKLIEMFRGETKDTAQEKKGPIGLVMYKHNPLLIKDPTAIGIALIDQPPDRNQIGRLIMYSVQEYPNGMPMKESKRLHLVMKRSLSSLDAIGMISQITLMSKVPAAKC